MELKKARNLLCIFFSIIAAIGAILTVGTLVTYSTLCNSRYMSNKLNSKSIVNQLDASYDAKLQALSAETGIPLRVFQAAKNEFISTETNVQRLFSEQDATMFSEDKTEIYERICTEYLDGNGIKYNKADIHMTAEKASSIYSSCYGISNGQALSDFISTFKSKVTGFTALGLLLMIIPFVIVLMLFTKNEKLFAQLLNYVTACGFALILFGLSGLVFGIGSEIMINPEIYANAIIRVIKTDFLISLIIGIAVSVFGIITAIKTNSKIIENRINNS
ncbi:MAG: hypothetical protein NC213_05665 [Acetobacter sp.]|nr:hypothetical protein [Bacteroides sp.]MCM1341215.1 hypothetical protein [Acetobacter sp.]MCM1433858.1 hypothetical protein [Clostridiales bacterium]